MADSRGHSVQGRGRSIETPDAFAGDDGRPDPRWEAAYAHPADVEALLRAGVRLLPFVAALLWRFVPVIVALLALLVLIAVNAVFSSRYPWWLWALIAWVPVQRVRLGAAG